ncbi:pili assembly chaperone [Kushneria pakistanensis]|uniref:Pili assembly chaperone n=1 Tax=Kushneria pakistanensis TaxID=1508770 RepID=A0ABQ3FII5_9GAMM|nr:molecular chaperone [Kushneria pakistanensis]GHC25726.1 pili assembly chaperone [Kushneria pakistanensis]
MTRILTGLLTAVVLSSLWLTAPVTQAASSILIWPINPVLSAGQGTRPLWLENQANMPATLQIRILRWQQLQHHDSYQPQEEVLPSPPIVTIAPGDRQLVRLTLAGAAPDAGEQAYRILIDEIPDAQQQAYEAQGSRVNFRMRYSVPLFVTSGEAPEDAERVAQALRWEVIKEGNKRYLRVHNDSRNHARLTRVQMDSAMLAEGLLGYVLANASHQWPLPDNMRAGENLTATVNGAEPIKLRHVEL